MGTRGVSTFGVWPIVLLRTREARCLSIASLWLCSVFQKQVTSNAQDSGLGARGYVRFRSGQGRIFLKKEVTVGPSDEG